MIMGIIKLLTSGPLDRVLSSLDKSIDNETERQRIVGNVVERVAVADADNRAAAMQSRVFWAIWALFAVPVGIWHGAVALDSVFLFSGHIADLPPSTKPYADQIVVSLFGSGGLVAGAQAIASAIRGRR
jgi:hypothetical protein